MPLRATLVLIPFLAVALQSTAQNLTRKTLYLVDAARVKHVGFSLEMVPPDSIASIQVLKDPEKQQYSAYSAYDSVMIIFTKAYMARPDSLKQIPSADKLNHINNQLYYKGKKYTGKVIDYQIDGSVQHEGMVENGIYVGTHSYQFFNSGTTLCTFSYSKNGAQTRHCVDKNGKISERMVRGEKGEMLLWERYHPNGQLKHLTKKSKNKTISASYYSSGLMWDSSVYYPDKKKHYVQPAIANYRDLIRKKQFAKAMELYPWHPGLYGSISYYKAENLQFEEALRYMDTSIALEPYEEIAYLERATIRVRKYAAQIDTSYGKFDSTFFKFLRTNPQLNIPTGEKVKILQDLQQGRAWSLIDRYFAILFRYTESENFRTTSP